MNDKEVAKVSKDNTIEYDLSINDIKQEVNDLLTAWKKKRNIE